jgi:hypothetical protein
MGSETGEWMTTWIARVQGWFYLLTGLWAILDIDSFQRVTGPKVDLWLVKTVGVLVIVIGATRPRSSCSPGSGASPARGADRRLCLASAARGKLPRCPTPSP